MCVCVCTCSYRYRYICSCFHTFVLLHTHTQSNTCINAYLCSYPIHVPAYTCAHKLLTWRGQLLVLLCFLAMVLFTLTSWCVSKCLIQQVVHLYKTQTDVDTSSVCCDLSSFFGLGNILPYKKQMQSSFFWFSCWVRNGSELKGRVSSLMTEVSLRLVLAHSDVNIMPLEWCWLKAEGGGKTFDRADFQVHIIFSSSTKSVRARVRVCVCVCNVNPVFFPLFSARLNVCFVPFLFFFFFSFKEILVGLVPVDVQKEFVCYRVLCSRLCW